MIHDFQLKYYIVSMARPPNFNHGIYSKPNRRLKLKMFVAYFKLLQECWEKKRRKTKSNYEPIFDFQFSIFFKMVDLFLFNWLRLREKQLRQFHLGMHVACVCVCEMDEWDCWRFASIYIKIGYDPFFTWASRVQPHASRKKKKNENK